MQSSSGKFVLNLFKVRGKRTWHEPSSLPLPARWHQRWPQHHPGLLPPCGTWPGWGRRSPRPPQSASCRTSPCPAAGQSGPASSRGSCGPRRRQRSAPDGPLGLAEVLGDVSEAPGLSVQLGLELTDAGLHLDHGLPASLQGVDLGLISTGGGVLVLGLQQLLVLLQVHGKLLLTAELIGKTGSIHHSTGGLVLRQPGLVGHFVQVAVQLAELALQLPLGGGDGLVDVGEVSQGLVGVSELLLSSATLTISSLEESTSLLKAVGNSSSPSIGGHLSISGSGLGRGL